VEDRLERARPLVGRERARLAGHAHEGEAVDAPPDGRVRDPALTLEVERAVLRERGGYHEPRSTHGGQSLAHRITSQRVQARSVLERSIWTELVLFEGQLSRQHVDEYPPAGGAPHHAAPTVPGIDEQT